jgi:hypothetical protein
MPFNISRTNDKVSVSLFADVYLPRGGKHRYRSVEPLGPMQDQLQKFADSLVTKGRKAAAKDGINLMAGGVTWIDNLDFKLPKPTAKKKR